MSQIPDIIFVEQDNVEQVDVITTGPQGPAGTLDASTLASTIFAADSKTIAFLRACNQGILYHNAMSPVVTQQVITAFKVIMGLDGTSIGLNKIARLRGNSNYFRRKLEEMGLHVYGDADSPIIPVMIYLPCKIACFSRECLKRGLAVVVVGFPATPVILSRARYVLLYVCTMHNACKFRAPCLHSVRTEHGQPH